MSKLGLHAEKFCLHSFRCYMGLAGCSDTMNWKVVVGCLQGYMGKSLPLLWGASRLGWDAFYCS